MRAVIRLKSLDLVFYQLKTYRLLNHLQVDLVWWMLPEWMQEFVLLIFLDH